MRIGTGLTHSLVSRQEQNGTERTEASKEKMKAKGEESSQSVEFLMRFVVVVVVVVVVDDARIPNSYL